MKLKNLKGVMLGFILGGIVFGGMGVVAVTLTANQVKYTPKNEKFTATNTEEALDEIYKIAEYEIPSDTYFYDSETSGEDIVRYKKVDGKYYLCDEFGKVINQEEQDISALTLNEYIQTDTDNLNIGFASFSASNLILGSGANLSSKNEQITKFYVSQNNTASYTFNNNYKKLYMLTTDSRDGSVKVYIDDVQITEDIEYIHPLADLVYGGSLGYIVINQKVSINSVITVKPSGGGSTSMILYGVK